uniref:Dystonin-like n=1 Tax=Pogona vitticeps TaxID=103695 RepID=A0ABM5GD73_9SAUR
MGNVGSRPSCLGEKNGRSEDFLKDSYLRDLGLAAPGCSSPGRNNAGAEGGAGPPEKPLLSPLVIENGWNGAQPGSPLPKQNNVDVKVQNGGLACNPLKAHLEAVAVAGEAGPWRSPPRSSGGSWAWKTPLPAAATTTTTTEVTEVTEVTETIVTEIVEVTEYPGGDKSQPPVIIRTVKVLTEGAGAVPEAASFHGHSWSRAPAQETLGKLLAWVKDMEELMAGQKPPSSEAKVARAQLQEQKLLRRLLDERRPLVEHLLQGRQQNPPEPSLAKEGWETNLSSLQETWATLIQRAEGRHRSLEKILPTACTFQESVDAFQDWLGSTERKLAQLWRANGNLNPTQEAHQQIQGLCEEIRAKTAELEGALGHGQRLMEMVPGKWPRPSQGGSGQSPPAGGEGRLGNRWRGPAAVPGRKDAPCAPEAFLSRRSLSAAASLGRTWAWG